VKWRQSVSCFNTIASSHKSTHKLTSLFPPRRIALEFTCQHSRMSSTNQPTEDRKSNETSLLGRMFGTNENGNKNEAANSFLGRIFGKIEDGDKNGLATGAPSLSWKTVQRALIGNSVITLLKFGVYFQTGSSAMLSEAIHTLADSGNQAFLLAGLAQSSNAPDKRFQYGYGRAAFFWALISAIGMFWTGAGVTIFHGGYALMHPMNHSVEMTSWLWAVLALSFLVDGYVLTSTLSEINQQRLPGVSLWQHLKKIQDPFILAVLLEDFVATTGVVIASAGIGATYLTGSVYFDSLASLGIGGLLAFVSLWLVKLNHSMLIGHAIDKETLSGIRGILQVRPSVEAVYAVQSQWVGPSTFSYKAEVDFDGTFLAAKLEDKYAPLFVTATDRADVDVLMSWYAEDITRLVEQEVRNIEAEIRIKYPAAAFIELEPDSKDFDKVALPKDPAFNSPDFKREMEEMRKSKDEIFKFK